MASSDPETWMEDLQGWVQDEGKLVTVKECSRIWRIHVNVAKQRIYAYLQDRKAAGSTGPEIQVVYCLAGTLKESGKKAVKLVKEENLTSVEETYSVLTSKHLWSLGPSGTTSLTMMTSLTSTLHNDAYLNTFSAIKNKKCVRRENAELTQTMEFKENQPRKTMPAPKPKSEVPSPPAASDTKEEVEKKKESSSKAKASASAKSGGKASGGIAGMFAKAASKKKVEIPVEVKTEESSPGKENRENEEKEAKESGRKQEDKVESEAPKRKKRGPSKQTKLESQPKRKRIQMMSDSESSEDEKMNDEEEDRNRAESPVPQAKEELKSSEDEDEIIPPTPTDKKATRTGRRRIRKLVEKTFKDEEGFLVCKKEMESCSETDNEEEPIPDLKAPQSIKSEAPDSVVKEPEKKSAGKTKKSAAPPASKGNKQASIMNFFKKK